MLKRRCELNVTVLIRWSGVEVRASLYGVRDRLVMAMTSKGVE